MQHNHICSFVSERKHATGSHSLTAHSFAKDRARPGHVIYYWIFAFFQLFWVRFLWLGGWWGKQFTNHPLMNCCCYQLSLSLGLLLCLVFCPQVLWVFVGETEYCGRSFLKCVARITGVSNDNTGSTSGTCHGEWFSTCPLFTASLAMQSHRAAQEPRRLHSWRWTVLWKRRWVCSLGESCLSWALERLTQVKYTVKNVLMLSF